MRTSPVPGSGVWVNYYEDEVSIPPGGHDVNQVDRGRARGPSDEYDEVLLRVERIVDVVERLLNVLVVKIGKSHARPVVAAT